MKQETTKDKEVNATKAIVIATSYQENAYRETRAQTAASSAMLGSGLGTAAGLVTSGAMGRALDTQKAKKAYKEECKENEGKKWKNGKCVDINEPDKAPSGTETNDISADSVDNKPESETDFCGNGDWNDKESTCKCWYGEPADDGKCPEIPANLT